VKSLYWVLLCCACHAQENLGPLQADRPGFTSPSGVVGLGVFQLENGYTLESARSGATGTKTVSGPQMLFRFGLSEALEVRFATNGYSWQALRADGFTSAAQGASDSVVSAKLRVVEQSSLRPEVAITGGLSLPIGGSAFAGSGYDPSFSLAAVKDLPRGFSVAANANIASITDERGRYSSTAESLWIAHSLRFASIFVEAYRTTISRTEGSATALDAGLFRNVGRNIQVDIDAGHTIAGDRPAWFATLGFVFRAPKRLFGRE
jgi:hypothetical protein